VKKPELRSSESGLRLRSFPKFQTISQKRARECGSQSPRLLHPLGRFLAVFMRVTYKGDLFNTGTG